MSDATRDASGLSADDAASRQARLQAGAQPLLVRLLELRDLVLDHLDPRRLLHDLLPGLEQRRPGRDLVGLADHLGVHPDHRLHDVRAGLGLPDLGRHLLVGLEDGRARRRLLHRLAQPDRPARGHRLGRVRRRHLPRPDDQHDQQRLRRQLLADPRVHPVRGDPGARRDGQHLQQPPAGGRQQHLGVVARRRRRHRDPDPDLRPGHPPERRTSSSPSGSTTPASATASTGSWCCRSASC